MTLLRRGILAHDLLDAPVVLHTVSLEHVVCLCLGRGLGIGIVEEVLDTEKDLLDRNRWFPSLLLVQDREANGPGWVDIGVEEGRYEFACRRVAC